MNVNDVTTTLIAPGGAIKTSSDGEVSGVLVLYTTADDPDTTGDFFDAHTDFRLRPSMVTPIWLHHALPIRASPTETIHITEPVGEGELTETPEGIVIRGLLAARYRYLAEILPQLGWSSGTAAHLVQRTPVRSGVHHIDRWPLGLDASITPTPAEPRTMPVRGVAPLRSLLDADAPRRRIVLLTR